jgi:hypothetical protein
MELELKMFYSYLAVFACWRAVPVSETVLEIEVAVE